MSASGADQVQGPVLIDTDPVISHPVPGPVDVQILKDVSNLETPESVAAGLVSLGKTDASNGTVELTTSPDEKEDTAGHEQPPSIEDGVLVDDKETAIHESDISLKETEDVWDALVVEEDNAADNAITIDKVDGTTLNDKDDEAMAGNGIPIIPEIESVATAEQGTRVDGDSIAPSANISEANALDDSVNDSATEIPTSALERKEKDEDGATPADGLLVETGNHNGAAEMNKRDDTDNVENAPEVSIQTPNGDTPAITEVAPQEKGNIVDVDTASAAAEGATFDVASEIKEANTSIDMNDSTVAQVNAVDLPVEQASGMKDNLATDPVEPEATTASEAVVETREDEPEAIEQAQSEDGLIIEATPAQADREDGAMVATETGVVVESNDAGVITEGVGQGRVDETSEPTSNAEPLVEEAEVGHEVAPITEDVDGTEVGGHEGPIRSVVEEHEVAEVAVHAVAVDETTNDTDASARAEGEPVVAGKEVTPPVEGSIANVAESGSSSNDATAFVEAESLPASEVIPVTVIEGEEVASTPHKVEDEEAPTTLDVQQETTTSTLKGHVIETEEVTEKAGEVEITGHDDAETSEQSIPAIAPTVLEVAEEPTPAPIGLSEDAFATTVNVETDATTSTAVEIETAPVEVASVEVEPETGEAAPSEEDPATILGAPPQVNDETADGDTSAPLEAKLVTQAADGTSIDDLGADNDTVVEIQPTNNETPVETVLNAEPSTSIVESEAVTEVPAPTVEIESAIIDTEVTQETPASIEGDVMPTIKSETSKVEDPTTLGTSSEIPPSITEAENVDIVGTSQATESVLQTDEGASLPIAPVAAGIVAIATTQEMIAEGESVVDEHASGEDTGELRTVIDAPDLDKEDNTLDAGIGNNTEVALEDVSVALTTSVEEMPSVNVSELEEEPKIEEETAIKVQQLPAVGEKAIDISSIDGSASVAVESVTTAGQDVVEESTSAPVAESVAVKDNVPELRTSAITVETSLDTTPFTPVLDSGIGFKEQESVSFTLPSIAEELDRSRSSWSSSFQVSSIGGGGTEPVPEKAGLPETSELVGAVTSENTISVVQSPLESPQHLWAPSYFVHSQGSPTRVESAEDFPSFDKSVPAHEPEDPTISAREPSPDNIPVEEGYKTEVINHNESSERIIEGVASAHVPSSEEVEQVAEPLLADASEETTSRPEIAVSEEDSAARVDEKLTLEDVPSASVITDVTSADRGIENHVGNAVTADSEHDNTTDKQICVTEVQDLPSTEVSHANPVVALEGQRIEDETSNPQQNTQAETNPNLELPARPWTPSYSVHSQGSPVAVSKEVEVPSSGADAIEQLIAESTSSASFFINTQGITHSEALTTGFNKGEIPSTVEQSQRNNVGGIVAASIAPTITLAALGAGIGNFGAVTDEETYVDATLTADTPTGPLLATDSIDDPPEQSRASSYSVMKQGADASHQEEPEVDHREPLSSAAGQGATTTDSEPQLNEVEETDSTSSALQTRPSYAMAGTEDIAKNEQFFLFGLRAIVAYIWVLPKWLSMTPSDHSRQGSSSSSSSSSSKIFPGSWFTSKPNEGRMSFDVAQGEFAPSTKVTTSNDVFETLNPEVVDSSAAVNVAAGEDGQKRRWCVVM